MPALYGVGTDQAERVGTDQAEHGDVSVSLPWVPLTARLIPL